MLSWAMMGLGFVIHEGPVLFLRAFSLRMMVDLLEIHGQGVYRLFPSLGGFHLLGVDPWKCANPSQLARFPHVVSL